MSTSLGHLKRNRVLSPEILWLPISLVYFINYSLIDFGLVLAAQLSAGLLVAMGINSFLIVSKEMYESINEKHLEEIAHTKSKGLSDHK